MKDRSITFEYICYFIFIFSRLGKISKGAAPRLGTVHRDLPDHAQLPPAAHRVLQRRLAEQENKEVAGQGRHAVRREHGARVRGAPGADDDIYPAHDERDGGRLTPRCVLNALQSLVLWVCAFFLCRASDFHHSPYITNDCVSFSIPVRCSSSLSPL